MKRPPGLWILLSAGVLCLSLQHVYGLKATELIFGKTTTTTTEVYADGEGVTEVSQASENATKSNFTGNPQIDYIYDPNLPRELNGYNLSSYPFYSSMPSDIDFKCDGLHDGFYASVPHKCQLYHQCLFSKRYDFLCANYTAFDQKTFICHFVSEVDCNNSHKYWHRNDDLYQTVSTTTVKPTPISISPALTASPRTPTPSMRRRRPTRRRPQYEYYDDDYEEDDYYEDPQPRRRRKRPRPRPRPIYDDYDDYEEDRYERRGSGRRNENRRDSEDRYDRRKDSYNRREYEDRRRYKDDRKRDYDDEPELRSDRDRKKNEDRKRKPMDDEHDNPRYYETRRTVDETRYDRPKNNRKQHNDNDDFDEDKRSSDRNRNPTGSDSGQPVVKPSGSSSIFNQPRMAPRIRPPVPKNEQNKFSYKPTTELPAPKKPTKEEKYDDYEDDLPPLRPTTRSKPEQETRPDRKSEPELRPERKFNSDRDDKRNFRRPILDTRIKPKRPVDDVYEDEEDKRPVQPKLRSKPDSYSRETIRNRGKDLEDDNYERRELSNSKNTSKEPRIESGEDLRIPTSTKAPGREQPDAVRVIKRPFLPSRGGNPFSNRGLQPVGAKALDIAQYDSEAITEKNEQKPTKPARNLENESSNVQNGRQFPEVKQNQEFDDSDDYYTTSPGKVNQQSKEESSESILDKDDIKPTPALIKVVNRLKGSPVDTETEEDPKSVNRGSVKPIRVEDDDNKSFEKPSSSARNPLDIYDTEIDVTLNDALNPTIPNLPIRSFPTGFSAANDYTYNNFNRPRNDFNYNRQTESRFQIRSPSQKIETVVQPYGNQGERKYVALPPGPAYSNFRPSPQITQAQSHGFYSVF